jgi:steroid 5-alpha reductase family enzyme
MSVYLLALGAILLIGTLAWVLSILVNDVSFVDSLWSLFFLLAAVIFAFDAEILSDRAWLVLGLVAIWALRLSLHITIRNWGEPEDYRYQKIRANNEPGFAVKSIYIVFGLQGVLAWIVAAPLLPAISASATLGILDGLAAVLWLAGFIFEAVGDYQLSRFQANANNKNQVLNTGLWRYTRHPNYFGEFCIWWAFWLFAVAAGAWWTVFSPVRPTLFFRGRYVSVPGRRRRGRHDDSFSPHFHCRSRTAVTFRILCYSRQRQPVLGVFGPAGW